VDAFTWQIISIAGYSLAGVLLVAAVFLFFKMNVPAIIGDLTGRTAARQIQEIRERNQLTGHKRFKPDVFNVERGLLTEDVSPFTGRSGKTSAELNRVNLKGETEDTSRPEVLESLPTVVLGAQEAAFENGLPSEWGADETEVLTPETEVLFEGPSVQADEQRVPWKEQNLAVSLTEVLSKYTETASSSADADARNELLVSLTEVLSNHDEGEHSLPTGKEHLSLTEVLTDFTKTVSPEVRKEVLLSITDILSNEDGQASRESRMLPPEPEIEVLSLTESRASVTEVLSQEEEAPRHPTVVLSSPTDVLSHQTEVVDDGGTEVLSPDHETTVLQPTGELEKEESDLPPIEFKIIKDIKVIHTDKKV
jgi:hypothetical protein